jgi:hypothetical protein
VNVLKHDRDQQSIGILSVYEKFSTDLRQTFDGLIDRIKEDCGVRLKDDVSMFARVDWDFFSMTPPMDTRFEEEEEEEERRMNQLLTTSLLLCFCSSALNPSAAETKQRVIAIMEAKRESAKPPISDQEDCYQAVGL